MSPAVDRPGARAGAVDSRTAFAHKELRCGAETGAGVAREGSSGGAGTRRLNPMDRTTPMPSLRTLICTAAAVLALAASLPAPADAQASTAHWRGTRSERLIDRAVRFYGFNPGRLTGEQTAAINRMWAELLGPGSRRAALTPNQATAIVYMALVFPDEEEGGWYPDRPGYPGGGYPDDGYPSPWGRECVQMQSQAYELGNLVSASEHDPGLFVMEPDRGRARALARQIQQRAVECRATTAADRAGDVLAALSAALPSRSEVARRVDVLKRAIRDAEPDRRGY